MTATTLRRAVRRMAVTAAITGTLFAGAGTAQAQSIETTTDEYLFSTSLSQFSSIRAEQPNAGQLDWSSDACSWSPDQPLGFDFTGACHRHDFGYRNYKKQSRFTDANRLRIDDNFHADMKTMCNGNTVCNGAAWTYYQAVRNFGAS
ncbi:phospholipase [Amycolatopsis antarctica]|uniref:Phospholipase n=1 Tax=Amycolatopsis antarctica TaxID=1854586 RepID=A0A263DAV5_9PSEU|nr:phospholipase [Amycolatopsis antarctica]OZM74647.1 phospholipase [Amycolatopsis antarctica]